MALAAPVEDGMMFWEAQRPPRQSCVVIWSKKNGNLLLKMAIEIVDIPIKNGDCP